MKYLINLSYDGSKFYGYQIQKNKNTVQGSLEKVLSKILDSKIKTTGSSRTDKDVHGLDQYCHFNTSKDIDVKKLKHSINSMIDESIYINLNQKAHFDLDMDITCEKLGKALNSLTSDYIYIKNVEEVADDFHARFNVKAKEYIYKINMGEYNPLEKNYVFQYNKTIDKDMLKDFCSLISGKHNFRSFTSDKDKVDYERDIIVDFRISNNILYLRFESSGFLRYMIRNIVGLLLDINDGKKSIIDIELIFRSEDRTSCGRCASGCGLYLNKITFKK